jgi:hypothetical protein
VLRDPGRQPKSGSCVPLTPGTAASRISPSSGELCPCASNPLSFSLTRRTEPPSTDGPAKCSPETLLAPRKPPDLPLGFSAVYVYARGRVRSGYTCCRWDGPEGGPCWPKQRGALHLNALRHERRPVDPRQEPGPLRDHVAVAWYPNPGRRLRQSLDARPPRSLSLLRASGPRRLKGARSRFGSCRPNMLAQDV